MGKLLTLSRMFYRFVRDIYLHIWRRNNSAKGNVHLDSSFAKIKKIPFSAKKLWMRPSNSDVSRVNEYLSKIYFNKSYLHEALKESKPTILIDLGANIGLSTLATIEEFPSIKKVIAVEAEKQNYNVLEQNFRLWQNDFSNVNFSALHAVVTNSSGLSMVECNSLASLTGRNTASGTFRYSVEKEGEALESVSSNLKTIALCDLIGSISEEEKIIIKIDIEGGEEYLFSSNTDWVNRCLFMTLELHDKFHPEMMNSSENTFRLLSSGKFAVSASEDILHCYSKDNLSLV